MWPPIMSRTPDSHATQWCAHYAFDTDQWTWEASVRFMWEDFMDGQSPFDLYIVMPDPPITIYQGTVATVLITQHPVPGKGCLCPYHGCDWTCQSSQHSDCILGCATYACWWSYCCSWWAPFVYDWWCPLTTVPTMEWASSTTSGSWNSRPWWFGPSSSCSWRERHATPIFFLRPEMTHCFSGSGRWRSCCLLHYETCYSQVWPRHSNWSRRNQLLPASFHDNRTTCTPMASGNAWPIPGRLGWPLGTPGNFHGRMSHAQAWFWYGLSTITGLSPTAWLLEPSNYSQPFKNGDSAFGRHGRMRFVPGAALDFHLVIPKPPTAEHRVIAHILLVQRQQPRWATVIVSVFDARAPEPEVRQMAITLPDQIQMDDLLQVIGVHRECTMVPPTLRCTAWHHDHTLRRGVPLPGRSAYPSLCRSPTRQPPFLSLWMSRTMMKLLRCNNLHCPSRAHSNWNSWFRRGPKWLLTSQQRHRHTLHSWMYTLTFSLTGPHLSNFPRKPMPRLRICINMSMGHPFMPCTSMSMDSKVTGHESWRCHDLRSRDCERALPCWSPTCARSLCWSCIHWRACCYGTCLGVGSPL